MKQNLIQQKIKTRVGDLAIVDQGAGLPVVFWPSLFSDHSLFDYVVSDLGDSWRTIRIDGPGFGNSNPLTAGEQPQLYAEAVLDVLEALQIEQAILAGCSWGGQVVIHAAVTFPEKIMGILAMNTPLGPSMGGQAMKIYGTRIMGSTKFLGKGVARSMVEPSFLKNRPDVIEGFTSRFKDFDKKTASQTVRAVMSQFPGLADVLPRISVPTIILMGAEDRLYPVEEMRKFADLADIADVEIIPNCGHLAPIEAPEAVCDALRRLASKIQKK